MKRTESSSGIQDHEVDMNIFWVTLKARGFSDYAEKLLDQGFAAADVWSKFIKGPPPLLQLKTQAGVVAETSGEVTLAELLRQQHAQRLKNWDREIKKL